MHNFPTHAVAVLPWVAPEILEQVDIRQFLLMQSLRVRFKRDY